MVRQGVSLGAGLAVVGAGALLAGAPVGSPVPVVSATVQLATHEILLSPGHHGRVVRVGSGDPTPPGWRWHRRTHPRR